MTKRPGDYVRAEDRKTCNRCGAHDLAWARSSRTGRYYLARTLPSQDAGKAAQGVRYVAPWAPHSCDEERRLQAEWAERMQREREQRERGDRIRAHVDAVAAARDAGDVAEIRRLTEEFDREMRSNR